jgi:hypothetical protein
MRKVTWKLGLAVSDCELQVISGSVWLALRNLCC